MRNEKILNSMEQLLYSLMYFLFLSSFHLSHVLFYTTVLLFHKRLFNCGNRTSHTQERKLTFVFHWPAFNHYHYFTAKRRAFRIEDSPKMIVAGQEDYVTSQPLWDICPCSAGSNLMPWTHPAVYKFTKVTEWHQHLITLSCKKGA